MTAPFLRAYSLLLIKTCHRRGAHAMGGMAAQIPIKNDPAANEARDGARARRQEARGDRRPRRHLGRPSRAWSEIAKAEFDAAMKGANQIARQRDDVNVERRRPASSCPRARSPRAGLRQNVAVGIGYVEAWLRGNGCVPMFNLMEDAATAEISRAQVWQWVRHGQTLQDGRPVTEGLRARDRARRTTR